MRGRAVGPVGIIRKLDRDAEVGALAPWIVGLDDHLSGRGCSDVNERAIARAIRTGVHAGGALDQEFDRHAACRDPAMGPVDVKTVAIAHRTVMDHQTAVATPRAGPIVDIRASPVLRAKIFVTAR